MGVKGNSIPFLSIFVYVLNHPEMQRKVEKVKYPPPHQGAWDLEYFQNQASGGGGQGGMEISILFFLFLLKASLSIGVLRNLMPLRYGFNYKWFQVKIN